MTEADLLAAVIADPDCDVLRLSYADWLDEQLGTGEATPRAEFVRAQMVLDRCPLCARIQGRGCINHDGLRRREQKLLDTYEPEWFAWRTKRQVLAANTTLVGCCNRHADYLACHCLRDAWDVLWRRGFVEAVTLSSADFRRHGDDLLAAAPVTEVTLTTWPRVETERDHDSNSVIYRLPGRKEFVSRRQLLKYLVNMRGMGEPTLREVTEALLNACWPQVRTWHLPA